MFIEPAGKDDVHSSNVHPKRRRHRVARVAMVVLAVTVVAGIAASVGCVVGLGFGDRLSDTRVLIGKELVAASLLNWHRSEDLTLLGAQTSVSGLPVTFEGPPGSWALSVGYPWTFDEEVPLLGAVIDDLDSYLYVDMAIQPGGSGSPVVNSKGEVMGVIVASLADSSDDVVSPWMTAITSEILCRELFDCQQHSITMRGSESS